MKKLPYCLFGFNIFTIIIYLDIYFDNLIEKKLFKKKKNFVNYLLPLKKKKCLKYIQYLC